MGKTYIVTGCYGSGKTEFCVNFALETRKYSHDKVYIADLDIINPYFRSREKAAYLKDFDIEIVGNALNNNTGQDIPAVSYSFLSLVSKGQNVIIDLAGSDNGMNLLAGCYDRFTDYELLCVLNLYRPETDSKEKMIDFIDGIHSICKLPVTGIINNSHMLHETEAEHILASQEVVLSVSEELNLPFKYTQIKRSVYDKIKDKILSDSLIFDKPQMRESWQ